MATTKQVKLPDLQLGTDKATALGAAIHNELVARGFTVGDDKVMAEYALIMLINKKSPDQVDRELSDFIGPDVWDPSFVDWLFEEAVKENPGASEPVEQAQTIVNEAPRPIPTLNTDSREREGGRRSGPPSRIYNQAVGGAQKRSASNRSPSPGSTPNKVAKKSDAPSGPRAMRGDQPDGNRRSLKDRLGGFGREPPHPNQIPIPMGPGGPRFPGPGMPPMGQFGPDMQAMQGMNPNFAEMLVQQNALLQGLLHTMANGMQMPMGGMPGMMPGAPGQFNGGMGPGFPDNGRGRGGSPTRGQRRLNPEGERQGNHGPPQNQVPGAPGPIVQAPTPLPAGSLQLPPDLFDRPISPTLCKFGVNCTNALCRYSHPSAAASVESGVVLSTEPCPKGRRCDDKDCTLSHPSAGTNLSGPVPQARANAAASTSSPFGVNAIPCKFGASCTRPGCPYSHPSTQPSQASQASQSLSVPCKFGIQCTRADCKFSHPPGRVNPASFKGLSGTTEVKPHANRSMRFNTGAAEFVPRQAGVGPNAAGAAPANKEGQSDATATPSGATASDSNPAEVIAAV